VNADKERGAPGTAGADINPDHVAREYIGKDVKLTVRDLDELVLIEGEPEALEMLGRMILAQARFTRDCGFEMSPRGPGSAFFTAESTRGLYVHVRRDGPPRPAG
jgi:hypothetical protein